MLIGKFQALHVILDLFRPDLWGIPSAVHGLLKMPYKLRINELGVLAGKLDVNAAATVTIQESTLHVLWPWSFAPPWLHGSEPSSLWSTTTCLRKVRQFSVSKLLGDQRAPDVGLCQCPLVRPHPLDFHERVIWVVHRPPTDVRICRHPSSRTSQARPFLPPPPSADPTSPTCSPRCKPCRPSPVLMAGSHGIHKSLTLLIVHFMSSWEKFPLHIGDVNVFVITLSSLCSSSLFSPRRLWIPLWRLVVGLQSSSSSASAHLLDEDDGAPEANVVVATLSSPVLAFSDILSSSSCSFRARASFSLAVCRSRRWRPSSVVPKAFCILLLHVSLWPQAGVPAMTPGQSSFFNLKRYKRRLSYVITAFPDWISSSANHLTFKSVCLSPSAGSHCQDELRTCASPSRSHRRRAPTRRTAPARETPACDPTAPPPALHVTLAPTSFQLVLLRLGLHVFSVVRSSHRTRSPLDGTTWYFDRRSAARSIRHTVPGCFPDKP